MSKPNRQTGAASRERRMIHLAAAGVRLEKREGKSPLIVGYGAVFYNAADPGTEYELWEGFVERIMPGTFDRAIQEDDVRGLFNHDPDNLLGRTTAGTMRLSVDATGLRYEIDPGNTQIAKDVCEHCERKDLTGSSFSFCVTDQTELKEDGKRVREIRGVKLFDVGPVTFPAYTGTSAQCRSEDIEGAKRFFEQRQQERAALAARLTQYQIRARLTEIGAD
jgi:HK97 family phage prohead protease